MAKDLGEDLVWEEVEIGGRREREDLGIRRSRRERKEGRRRRRREGGVGGRARGESSDGSRSRVPGRLSSTSSSSLPPLLPLLHPLHFPFQGPDSILKRKVSTLEILVFGEENFSFGGDVLEPSKRRERRRKGRMVNSTSSFPPRIHPTLVSFRLRRLTFQRSSASS
ncbi:hypothetical protein BDY24DRAFT_393005 [Mrakia frigida]|uniref:uncharacterized protein n=1 Tax=Mrakia frigida TaxID=29902 RepID=UPI003FCC2602